MTRLDRSDAQLDAEAEARRHHLTPPRPEHGFDDPDAYDPPAFAPSPPPKGLAVEPRKDGYGLHWLILDLRRALAAETVSRLHAQAASGQGDPLGDRSDTDQGGIGVPFSNAFHRWLGTSRGPSKVQQWDRGPDPMIRPAMASILAESDRCHALHTSHARPGFARSLCSQLLFEVGVLGQEPEDLAWLHELPLEQVKHMLHAALKHARLNRIDAEARAMRSMEPMPVPERRPFRAGAA